MRHRRAGRRQATEADPFEIPEPETEQEPSSVANTVSAYPPQDSAPLSTVLHLGNRLTSIAGYTPVQRIERAHRAGISARLVLVGINRVVTSTPPLRAAHGRAARFYVVLRTSTSRDLQLFRSFALYCRAVKLEDGTFDQQSISHGWLSEAEALVYVLAAGWQALPPPTL